MTMINKYFNKTKKDIFPHITDWSDPQDEIRNEYDIKKLTLNEFFWCHPLAYNLVFFGIPCAIMFNSILAGIAAWRWWPPGILLAAAIFALGGYDLWKRKRRFQPELKTTFYDFYLREYDLGEIK